MTTPNRTICTFPMIKNLAVAFALSTALAGAHAAQGEASITQTTLVASLNTSNATEASLSRADNEPARRAGPAFPQSGTADEAIPESNLTLLLLAAAAAMGLVIVRRSGGR